MSSPWVHWRTLLRNFRREKCFWWDPKGISTKKDFLRIVRMFFQVAVSVV